MSSDFDRSVFADARRVVVKVGSSSLTTPDGHIDLDRVSALVAVISESINSSDGRQIILVSSGAIAAGIGPLGLDSRPTDVPTAQAAASVGQGALMAAYSAGFAAHGLVAGQVLLTSDDFARRAHHRNAEHTFNRLLNLSVVPVVNENDTVATDELRFGDNDRLAALVAHLVGADALVLLSDVDGLYDRPPADPQAVVIRQVDDIDELKSLNIAGTSTRVGSGGMRTKVDAAAIANEAGIPVLVTSAAHAADALAGQSVGTVFSPAQQQRNRRGWWLAHASDVRGRLLLDAGAARAIGAGQASLLPAGVVGVEGDFSAGDVVDLVGPDNQVIARGFCSFDAQEVPQLLGRKTAELADELGPGYQRELIHRDDLVVLSSSDVN